MSATVGFIGAGNMGSAIMRGLAGKDGLAIAAFDPDASKLEALARDCGVKAAADAAEAVRMSDYVMLCVKPQAMRPVLEGLAPELTPEKCLLSIAAGITSATLMRWSGDVCPVIRVMPNTPAMVGEGVYAVCLENSKLTEGQKAFAVELFSGIGQTHVLEEKYFDAFTAVAGCGPAYVMYFMEALVEAGVYLGLPRAQTTEIVTALFSGSVKLAKESGMHMSVLREMVTSPAGSTIRGTAHFDRKAVRAAIVDAVAAACDRNRELGG